MIGALWAKLSGLLAALLLIATIIFKVFFGRYQELNEQVYHYKAKEAADELRAKPVSRDKSAILDRM